jgi:nicotinamide-nucleotide amidase
MKATILTIGDEILIGQIVNTNAAWMGEELTRIGVRPERMVVVGDEAEHIAAALRDGMRTSRVLLVTGGLGPTHDDITRQVLADVFEAPLRCDPAILDVVRQRFERRGWEMPASNHSQALVPQGFEAVVNPAGTAPLLLGRYEHPDGPGLIAALPGVPYEMQHFVTEEVLPRVMDMEGAPAIRQKTLLTVGIGESHLTDVLDGVEDLLVDGVQLAFLPNLRSLRLRMTSTRSDDGNHNAMDRLEAFVRERAGKWIFGEGTDTLESVLGRMLAERGLTVATAESCTGGYVSHRLTNVAGSSGWVLGGVVSYANSVKEEQLGVQAETLASFGAVSQETACEMANGVRERLGASIGLSTTGVLGPGGGTPDKPVGTFWMGVSSSRGTRALRLRLGTDRLRNKERASTAVLDLLRRELLLMAGEVE